MRNFLALAALATGLVACGVGGEGLEDRTNEPGVLATVTGSIRDPKGLAARGQLRAAVLWQNAQGGPGSYYRTTDDVALSPVALGTFRLDITQPPPEEVVAQNVMHYTLPPEEVRLITPMRYAQAQLVIYDDRNGNGALDFVDPEASEAIDDIVGVANLAHLFWFEGPIPDILTFPENMGRPRPGFNWAFDIPLIAPASYLGAYTRATPASTNDDVTDNGTENLPPAGPFGWHDVDTPIAVEFTDDPFFDLLMCNDFLFCPAHRILHPNPRPDLPPLPQ